MNLLKTCARAFLLLCLAGDSAIFSFVGGTKSRWTIGVVKLICIQNKLFFLILDTFSDILHLQTFGSALTFSLVITHNSQNEEEVRS